MTLETVPGNKFLKQDRNKHRVRRHLRRRSHFRIVSGDGSTSNQGNTTKAVSKCQKRWPDCFDTILQYFEKKTERSNSESSHQCFIQQSRLLRVGQFEHGEVLFAKKKSGGAKKRFQHCLNPHSAETILHFRAVLGHSGRKHIDPALRDNVLRLRRVRLPRWKLPRHALNHPIRIDFGWKRYQESAKRNLFPKAIKLGRNPLHTEPVLQLTRKVEIIRKRHGTTISTYRRTHRTTWKPSSPWSERSVENHLAILWKI